MNYIVLAILYPAYTTPKNKRIHVTVGYKQFSSKIITDTKIEIINSTSDIAIVFPIIVNIFLYFLIYSPHPFITTPFRIKHLLTTFFTGYFTGELSNSSILSTITLATIPFELT